MACPHPAFSPIPSILAPALPQIPVGKSYFRASPCFPPTPELYLFHYISSISIFFFSCSLLTLWGPSRPVSSHLYLLPPLGLFLGLLGWLPLLFLTSIFCVLSLLFSSVHVLQNMREKLVHFMTVNTTSVLCAEDFQINISSPNLSSALNTWISSYKPAILWMSPLTCATCFLSILVVS